MAERIDVRVIDNYKREGSPGSAGLNSQLPGCCTTVSALSIYSDGLVERDNG